MTSADSYKVLAVDEVVYGPVDLPTLTQWVKEGRVLPTTWVQSVAANEWRQASQLEWFTEHFSAGSSASENPPESRDPGAVSVQELRQFEHLSTYSNEELERLLSYCEVLVVQPNEVIIKKGDVSDAVFLLLSGRARARLMVGRQETRLGAISSGEVFGEVAMLSRTPRSADVVADTDSRLLRLSSEDFQLLLEQEAGLALRMLLNISRSMAKRLAERNVDLAKDIASSFVWR